MKLIYRAATINFEPQALPAYRQPHAINWRYQVPGESYEPTTPIKQSYSFPKAINWRWQVTASPCL